VCGWWWWEEKGKEKYPWSLQEVVFIHQLIIGAILSNFPNRLICARVVGE
jgi:hypothetical protein